MSQVASAAMYPPCRICKAGELVPFSDYADNGASILFQSWVCSHDTCAAGLKIHSGEVRRIRAIPAVEAPPEPAPPRQPTPPQRRRWKGSTWQAWPAMTAHDAAREHDHRRESIERRLARVDEAIALWGAWEANQARPPDEHLPLTPPELLLAECLDVRRLLDEELARQEPA